MTSSKSGRSDTKPGKREKEKRLNRLVLPRHPMTGDRESLVANRRGAIGVETGTMGHVGASFNRALPIDRAPPVASGVGNETI